MIIQCQGTKILIANRKIQRGIDELKYWYGVKLTKQQFLKFLRKHADIASEVMTGVDTVAREKMIETLSYDLIKDYWPTFGEGRNGKFEKFLKKFNRAAIKAGYKITNDGE